MKYDGLWPMDRLAAGLADAENGLREAMHAIHDVAADTATPGDWYDRLGQLEMLTSRLGDLVDETATRVRRLPAAGLYTTSGSDTSAVLTTASDTLLNASRRVQAANRDVNFAWSHIGTVGVRDDEGGTS
jgi:hypothetical protein